MSTAERLARLESRVEGAVAEVRQTAASAPRGGDDRWTAVLRRLGVEPLGHEERARHLEQGSPIDRGPLPMEYRWALEAIQRQAAPACRQLDMSIQPDDDATQRAIDKLAHRIELLVDDELRAYMNSVRPTISTSSIFANAMATSQKTLDHPLAAAAGVSTTQCSCCGAPRQRGRESMICEFCGSNLG